MTTVSTMQVPSFCSLTWVGNNQQYGIGTVLYQLWNDICKIINVNRFKIKIYFRHQIISGIFLRSFFSIPDELKQCAKPTMNNKRTGLGFSTKLS